MKRVFPETTVLACVRHLPTCVRTKHADGIDNTLISLLSQALKSNLNIVFPTDSQFGYPLENGSWTGLIGMITRNEADIAMSYLSFTKERAKVADFSEPYSRQHISIVTNVPRLKPKSLIFLYPFEPTIWLGILALLFLLPIVLRFLIKLDYCRCFLMVFGNLIEQDAYRNYAGRSLFVLLFWLVCFVISKSFSSLVFSFLTIPLYETPVDSFEDLTKAVKSGTHEAFYRKGTTPPRILEDYGLEYLSKKLQAMDTDVWVSMHNKDMFGITKSGKEMAFVSFHSEFIFFFYGTPIPPTKFMSGNDEIYTDIGIYVRKGFCCKAALDKAIVKIKHAGLYDQSLNFIAYKKNIQLKSNTSSVTHERSFSLQDISGALILWASGVTLSLFTLILEIICGRLT